MRKCKKRAKDKVGKGARGRREEEMEVEDGKKGKGPKTHQEMEVVGERQ